MYRSNGDPLATLSNGMHAWSNDILFHMRNFILCCTVQSDTQKYVHYLHTYMLCLRMITLCIIHT